jgi:hypothetical protein
LIQTLIDKQDNFEVIRDQIAAILVLESNNQQALAVSEGKDSNLWKLRVFNERYNPWEQFLNTNTDRSPLVNVWYDTSNFDGSASNIVERQKAEAIYNIDCFGYGISSDDGATGHNPGDREAAFEVQRALRLVRNILMSSTYTYLGLRGLVWQRWPQSISVFQPNLDAQQVQKIVGARLELRVMFNEFSPQYVPETLEYLSVDVFRNEDGQLIAEADFDYTA